LLPNLNHTSFFLILVAHQITRKKHNKKKGDMGHELDLSLSLPLVVEKISKLTDKQAELKLRSNLP